jgi:hypothetical protein
MRRNHMSPGPTPPSDKETLFKQEFNEVKKLWNTAFAKDYGIEIGRAHV